jgi:hypothetical protein
LDEAGKSSYDFAKILEYKGILNLFDDCLKKKNDSNRNIITKNSDIKMNENKDELIEKLNDEKKIIEKKNKIMNEKIKIIEIEKIKLIEKFNLLEIEKNKIIEKLKEENKNLEEKNKIMEEKINIIENDKK